MHGVPQSDTGVPSVLSLAGNCGYSIEDGRAILTIAEIANRRGTDNLSGTLSIELWAMEQPYGGGAFSGVAVAGTSIGELRGQQGLTDCRYDLILQEPPAGTWKLSLMLREWTGLGYVTRDYVNFARPYIGGGPGTLHSVSDNAAAAGRDGNGTSVGQAAPERPVVGELPEQAGDKPQAQAAVSLNRSSPQDLAAVKGISKKLAEKLVAARPFGSFDEVLKVKGIGTTLLRKIRQFVTL
jgi:hypothetical protein